MGSPSKLGPLSPSKLNYGSPGSSSPAKGGISKQHSTDSWTARERFASEGQENQPGASRHDTASPAAHVQLQQPAEQTPEPEAADGEGRAYSPNSNPFGKRPATRTPAGNCIAARRRTSGTSDSGLPRVPDFRGDGDDGSQGPATPASPQLELLTGPFEDDAEAQGWLSSPDVAFDEVASTWEAVGRLSDLYDEALNDSMKKVHGNQVRAPSASPSPSPPPSDRSQVLPCSSDANTRPKPEVAAALATVAEDEELHEGGPAVGRLPLVTELSVADVPRQTAAAFSNLFEYGSNFLSQLPMAGLSAVTEEPVPDEDAAAAATTAAPGSPVPVAGEQGPDAAQAESPPAATSSSPSSVDPAAAAWRGRAFNAAFQGSPTLSGSREASLNTATLDVMSSPPRTVAGAQEDADGAAPSPAEEHPRSHRLQRSDSLDSLASLAGLAVMDGSGADAAEAAAARLARGGADLRASLEAVATSIRSIVARRPEPFAPAQPSIAEGPEAAPGVVSEGFASPISMAAPTTAGASPASLQEAVEVDELTVCDEATEPQPAIDGKPAEQTLLRTASSVRPNWATAPSTGIADMLHGVLAVCFIAALAAHLHFLPNAFVRSAPFAPSRPGGMGSVAAYPMTMSQTWQGIRSGVMHVYAATPALSTLVMRTEVLERAAVTSTQHAQHGPSGRARPPAPLRGAKARASEQLFREQDFEAPSAAKAEPQAPAPLIGAAARASAARFISQTSSLASPTRPKTIGEAPAAPSATPMPPPAAALLPLPPMPPTSQSPAASAVNAPAKLVTVQPSKAARTMHESPSTTDASSAPVATAVKRTAATAAAPTVLLRWAARVRAAWRTRAAFVPIKPVPLAAVLSALDARAGLGNAGPGGASALTGAMAGIAQTPVLVTTAVTLALALAISMLLRRLSPVNTALSAAPEAEEAVEEEEEEEEEDDTSSIATGLASPAQSISQLLGSALRSGSAPRSAARTISRQQAASHLKATTRRKITSQHDDDDASDGEAVGRDDEDDGEEEGGTPVVTISRSLRRLTRAMSHTLSGAVSAPVDQGEEIISKRTPQTAPRRTDPRGIRQTAASTAEPASRRITRSRRGV